MAAVRTGKLALLVLAAALASCDGDDGEGEGGEGEVQRLGAAELQRVLSELDGAARLERFAGGVVVSGEVEEVVDLADMGGYRLRLAAGDAAHVLVRFADEGVEAEERSIDEGDEVTVRCRLGGTAGDNVTLRDCELVR